MSSPADLFVVCKQCGSEVSPYVTECPYCGYRLRKRAPALPRKRDSGGGQGPGKSSGRSTRRVTRRAKFLEGYVGRPYATLLLVAISAAAWVAWHAEPAVFFDMVIAGSLHGDWWKLVSSQFAYINGYYAFFVLLAVALFGWLLERRHGPLVVLGLFLLAGVLASIVTLAVYLEPALSGANAGALALLVAWAVPDLLAVGANADYEGDLLGVVAFAAVLLALPFALTEVNWLTGVLGALVGLCVGLPLARGGRSVV